MGHRHRGVLIRCPNDECEMGTLSAFPTALHYIETDLENRYTHMESAGGGDTEPDDTTECQCSCGWTGVFTDLTVYNCARCGSNLTYGRCRDETCPFSDYPQSDLKGWTGHPKYDEMAARAR